MSLRPPRFWANAPDAPGWQAHLLAPAAALVGLAARLRQRHARPRKVAAPVICVGNLVVGGAGKTPTVLALCERLAALGAHPHVITRGYGGRAIGARRVDPERDGHRDVGDEALLIARRWPVWAGRDRVASAEAAVAAGADVLVMDDGFQNPSLAKDLSVLVIDAGFGHGNGRVMPAGPLREPLAVGFARADAVVVIGDPPRSGVWPTLPRGLPAFRARISPAAGAASLSGRRVLAFAGIGRPEKFFATLGQLGATLVGAEAFPDHHVYSAAILTRLEARARALDARLVTTEKDWVRLPGWFAPKATALAVGLGFAEPALVDHMLEAALGRTPSDQTIT